MKHHILFVLVFLAATGTGTAQQNIKGKVTDKGNKPIPGTVISLLNSGDSSLVKMSITDKNGYYTIARTGESQLLIKAEKERYTTQILPAGSSDSIVNFELTAVKALDEVIITSRKKLIEEKADRTVFNIENSVVAFGGNALEALKKMPGVQVQQQQIKIGDNSGVNIMLNGQLQHLAGDELVQLKKHTGEQPL
jgi:hypothetical protein